MTFRCCSCQSVVWLQKAQADEEAGGRCRACGRWYDLNALGGTEFRGAGLTGEARRLSFASGIDLPAAYSVALGIMTLEDVRKRLPQLSKKQRREEARAGDGAATRPLWRRALLPLLVLLALGAAAWQLGPTPSSVTLASAAPKRSTVGTAEVLTDHLGRVVQVWAPDPRSVLAAYCRSGQTGERYVPVDLVPSPLRPSGSRLGLLRDTSGEGHVLALTIDEDRTTERWVAGNGLAPLVPSAAPAWAERARPQP